MGRIRRVVMPGQSMHITDRGSNREIIFQDDGDRHECIELLQKARVKHSCAIHAYVFMSNHIHLLVTPLFESSAADMMHDVGSQYATHFNRRHGRTGPFWGARYHSSLVDSHSYFFACSRYIELNPVRAQMVNDPSEHVWSSYHHNADGESNGLITPHSMYTGLAKRDGARVAAYGAMFAHSLEPETIATIRNAVHRGAVTGDSVFQSNLETMMGRRMPTGKRGGDRRSAHYRSGL